MQLFTISPKMYNKWQSSNFNSKKYQLSKDEIVYSVLALNRLFYVDNKTKRQN